MPALRSRSKTVMTSEAVTSENVTSEVVTSVTSVEKNEVEVEFSRLETSSSSSCSAEDEENNAVRQPPQVTSPFAASMPNLNNNVEQVKEEERPPVPPKQQRAGQYGRRLEYQPPAAKDGAVYENFVLRSNLGRCGRRSASTHEFTKRSTTVKRNPSRLYRVVRPLTEVTHAPSPATKRCIGPEFVVMGDSDPVTLDLHCASASASRNAPCRTVQVCVY